MGHVPPVTLASWPAHANGPHLMALHILLDVLANIGPPSLLSSFQGLCGQFLSLGYSCCYLLYTYYSIYILLFTVYMYYLLYIYTLYYTIYLLYIYYLLYTYILCYLLYIYCYLLYIFHSSFIVILIFVVQYMAH